MAPRQKKLGEKPKSMITMHWKNSRFYFCLCNGFVRILKAVATFQRANSAGHSVLFKGVVRGFVMHRGAFSPRTTPQSSPGTSVKDLLYKQSSAAKIVFILHAVVVTASYGNWLQISRFITLHSSMLLSSKLSLPGYALGTHILVPSCLCAAPVTASVPQCPFSLCVINLCMNVF